MCDGVLVLALVAGTLAANLAPSLVYRAEHGANPAVERSAAADESSNEALALRPANLILPAPGSRIGPLRAVTARYDHAIAPGYCEACYASLGTVGTVGFGWLAVCGVGTLLGAGWARRRCCGGACERRRGDRAGGRQRSAASGRCSRCS